MQYLRADTITEVTVGPAVAVGDGFTPVTTLVGASADEFEIIKHGATTTTAIAGTLAAITGADGYYALDLSATDSNTEGRLTLLINDDSLILPIKQEFMVVSANVFDSLFAVSGTDVLDINVTQWLGTAAATPTVAGVPEVDMTHLVGVTQSATDLKDFADAGYDPVTNKVQGVVLVDTTTTNTDMRGTDSAATAANLATAQADLDIITDSDGVIIGAAGIDLVWDEVLTGATHNIVDSAGRRLRDLQEFGVYEGGAIWIDTVNGSPGTTDFESGTAFNPVNSMADANTLAASLGLSKFQIASGSTITLAASQLNQVFMGENWALALGGQNIDGSAFIGATVTGIATNTTGEQHFHECAMGAVTLPGDTHCLDSGIIGTQTFGEAGDFFYDQCHSAVAGAASPTVDFGSGLNASTLHVRHHSGGWTVENMGAGTGTYEASFEGNGQIVWAASCSATSNASIRGNWKITDNASGAVTETLDDNQTGVDAAVALFTTQLTEAYAADGVAPTPAQALFLIQQMLTDFGIAGTVLTVREIDGATVAATFTLDDGTNPTDLTRAT